MVAADVTRWTPRNVGGGLKQDVPLIVPPGFGLRQSSGAFRWAQRARKRQRTAAVQDADARFTATRLIVAFLLQLAVCVALLAAFSAHASELKLDERVVLYPALASRTAAGWVLDLHGIVFEPERRRLLTATLRKAFDIDEESLTSAEVAIFNERCRYFLVDNERGKKFTAMLAIIGSRRADLAACTSMMNCFSGLIALVHMPCRILTLFHAVLWNRHCYLFFYTSIGICH